MSQPLIEPADVAFPDGAATSLYLIGSAEDNSLGWLVQTVQGMQTAPEGVPTGNSGLATPATDTPAWMWAAALALVISGWATIRRRSVVANRR